jgi:hypothetical protein
LFLRDPHYTHHVNQKLIFLVLLTAAPMPAQATSREILNTKVLCTGAGGRAVFTASAFASLGVPITRQDEQH